ncbi:MAG: ChbG/HpnK family deacetylase [Candidatus Omnitrophota bacterium]
MKNLIVTADDFGMTKSISQGIARACKDGIVTTVSFLPTGEAFRDAVRMAGELGLKEAGAHLSLTETRPLTDPSGIPDLVTKDGRFLGGRNAFFMKFFLKGIDREQIYIEFRSQLDAIKKTGLPITHLSAHEHIHMMPDILKIFVRLAKEYDIPVIRYPHKDRQAGNSGIGVFYRSLILSYFAKGMKETLDNASVGYADHFMGFFDSGKIGEDSLLKMLGALEDGSTELVCHPGFLGPEILDRYHFHMNCENELFALTSPRVKKLIVEKGIQLTTYLKYLATK